MQRLPEIVQIEEVSQRQRITDEEALQAVYDAVWDALQIPALETNPIADSLQVEVQYIPVDMGTNAGEYVYDIGFYVKQLIDQDGADKLWHLQVLSMQQCRIAIALQWQKIRMKSFRQSI